MAVVWLAGRGERTPAGEVLAAKGCDVVCGRRAPSDLWKQSAVKPLLEPSHRDDVRGLVSAVQPRVLHIVEVGASIRKRERIAVDARSGNVHRRQPIQRPARLLEVEPASPGQAHADGLARRSASVRHIRSAAVPFDQALTVCCRVVPADGLHDRTFGMVPNRSTVTLDREHPSLSSKARQVSRRREAGCFILS